LHYIELLPDSSSRLTQCERPLGQLQIARGPKHLPAGSRLCRGRLGHRHRRQSYGPRVGGRAVKVLAVEFSICITTIVVVVALAIVI
jgi:hypothetical protein